jgi:hypothetical protein
MIAYIRPFADITRRKQAKEFILGASSVRPLLLYFVIRSLNCHEKFSCVVIWPTLDISALKGLPKDLYSDR